MLMLLSNGLIFLGAVCAFYCLHHYMKETNRKMNWWKWILAVCWALGVMFSVAVLGTFIGEGASQAVAPGGLFFLVVILISGAVVYKLLFGGFGKKKEA